MKRRIVILSLVFILFSLQTACDVIDATDSAEQSVLPVNLESEPEEETELESENNSKKEQNNFAPREKHTYNADDADKNLLLQFLHDEIPIINYMEEGETVYFSDLSEDGLKYTDEKSYHIVDMDGDGRQDFCFTYPASRDIIRYNEEMMCFELWLSTSDKQFPLGDKQMCHTLFTTANVYTYLRYDEFASLVAEQSYSVSEHHDKEKNASYTVYEIDFQPVSESEWNEASAYLFSLRENAPKELSYQDLLPIPKL